jgi:hypothetical protein
LRFDEFDALPHSVHRDALVEPAPPRRHAGPYARKRSIAACVIVGARTHGRAWRVGARPEPARQNRPREDSRRHRIQSDLAQARLMSAPTYATPCPRGRCCPVVGGVSYVMRDRTPSLPLHPLLILRYHFGALDPSDHVRPPTDWSLPVSERNGGERQPVGPPLASSRHWPQAG